ncbi:MAG: hypothetical protein HFI42_11300 [Lachnospiraceae bacterium]|nr:hypothetical protein [Lachnospiraceae bacterium]
MKGFRRPFRYGGLSIQNEFRQVHLYLVVLITFVIIQYCIGGVADYLAKSADRMHVLELYIHFMTTEYSQMIYLLGIIAFSCGTLFYSHGAAYYLIRGSRRSWALGQCIYLLVMVVCCNLFLLFSLCLSTGGHLTLANQWSEASFVAEQFKCPSIGMIYLIEVYYSILLMSPAAAGLVTFLLSVLVGMATGMVVICCGMRAKGIFGVAIIGITWFADYLIEDSSIASTLRLASPYGVSKLGWLLSRGGSLGILYGIVFFCILIAIEFYILLGSAEKIDFVKLE